MVMPGFAHRIIMLAGIRIDHQRQRRQAVQMRQRRGGVFQRDTVDPQRDNLWIAFERRNDIPQRRPVTQMSLSRG